MDFAGRRSRWYIIGAVLAAGLVVGLIALFARTSTHSSKIEIAIFDIFRVRNTSYKPANESLRVFLREAKEIRVETKRSDIHIELVSDADSSEMGTDPAISGGAGFGLFQVQGDLPISQSGKHLSMIRNGGDVDLGVFDLKAGDSEDFLIGDREAPQVTLKIPADFVGRLKIKTTSGDISIEDLKIENLESRSVSGDLEIGAVKIHELDFKSVSGSLTGVVSLSSLKCETVSGDIDLDLPESGERFSKGEVKNVSGVTLLRLPSTSDMTVTAKSISGVIDSEWPEIQMQTPASGNEAKGTIGSGAAHLDVKSESGEISFGKTL
jgi:hypothetical protein